MEVNVLPTEGGSLAFEKKNLQLIVHELTGID